MTRDTQPFKVDVRGFEDRPKSLDEIHKILDMVWEGFASKYGEYGEGAADALGLAGQWGDLHRKLMKLRRSFWVGESGYLVTEQEAEILRDMIGHCLLAIHMLDRGFEGGRR